MQLCAMCILVVTQVEAKFVDDAGIQFDFPCTSMTKWLEDCVFATVATASLSPPYSGSISPWLWLG